MNEGKRRHVLEQKQAFHNAMISIPYFISAVPTKAVAVSHPRSALVPSSIPQQNKLFHSGSRFIKTTILLFNSLQEAMSLVETYHQQQASWCEYCKDVAPMQGIFYQPGKVYVTSFENKDLKEMLNDVSQLVVVDGLEVEQALRKEGSGLFAFLDQNTVSLEHDYYRWRVYAYLQGDGQRHCRSEPFRMMQDGAEWHPPAPSTIQSSILNHEQRRYFSSLLLSLTNRKSSIEEAMVFCIFNTGKEVEIISIIVLAIFESLSEATEIAEISKVEGTSQSSSASKGDFLRFIYLISDVLFNATEQNYRRLFARMLPFIVFQIRKRTLGKSRGQLKGLVRSWEEKFIFDEEFTKGLLFMLDEDSNVKQQDNKRKETGRVKQMHDKLKTICNIPNERESNQQLERLCFSNGFPLIQNQKEECKHLLNEYLWRYDHQHEEVAPEPSQSYDGEPLCQKDLLKIKNKQVKVVSCGNLPLTSVLQKNWQTRGKSSVDQS